MRILIKSNCNGIYIYIHKYIFLVLYFISTITKRECHVFLRIFKLNVQSEANTKQSNAIHARIFAGPTSSRRLNQTNYPFKKIRPITIHHINIQVYSIAIANLPCLPKE